MNEERDKFLTEAMGYHNVHINDRGEIYASLPGDELRGFVGQSGSWALLGKRWEWAQRQEWWESFGRWIVDGDYMGLFPESYIHPESFPRTLYDFLKERKRHGSTFAIASSETT